MPARSTPRLRVGRAPVLALSLAIAPVAAPVAQSTWLHAWQPTPLGFGTAGGERFEAGLGFPNDAELIFGTATNLTTGARRSTWWSPTTGVRPDDIPLEPTSTQRIWSHATAAGLIVGGELQPNSPSSLLVTFDPTTNQKRVLPPPPLANADWAVRPLAVSPAGLALAVTRDDPAHQGMRVFWCDLNQPVPVWSSTGITAPSTGRTRRILAGDIGVDGSIAVAYDDQIAPNGSPFPVLEVIDPHGASRIELNGTEARQVTGVRVLADGTVRFRYLPVPPANDRDYVGRRTAQGIENVLVISYASRLTIVGSLRCDDRGRILCAESLPGGGFRPGLYQDGRFQTFDALCTDALALEAAQAALTISRQGKVLAQARQHAGNPVDAVVLRPSIEPVLSFHVDATRPDADFDCIYDASQTDDMVLRIDGAVPGVLWFLYFGDSRFGVPLGLPFHIGITDANGSGELRFPRAAFSPALFASQPDVLFLASALDPTFRLRASTIRRVTLR